MLSPRDAYRLLLRLYPGSFRDAFGDAMLQTFADLHADAVRAHGRAGAAFWAGVLADALPSLAAEHAAALRSPSRLLLLALFPPVFAVFLMALVRIALAVPHPPVHGVGFPLALAGLLTASAALSVATLRAVAEAGTFLRLRRL